MGADDNWQSNLSLPLGKVRIGLRTRGTEVSKEKGVPKHSQINENPDRNPKNIYQLKKSVKKSNPCSP